MTLNKEWKATPEGMMDAFVWWYNEHVHDFDVSTIIKDEVYVVWFCYILGRVKALISTTRPDHNYYELTYDINKEMLYVDQYVKLSHTDIPIVE